MSDSHDKFIDHIMNGGRVLRIDSLNNCYEILSQEHLQKIENFGYNDLIILTDDKLSAIDMLELIFKQQRKTTHYELKDIIDLINIKYEHDIRPIRIAQKFISNKINIDGSSYDFKVSVIGFDENEYLLDANIFVDNKETIIMNLYPKTHLIGPYKKESIYDELDKLVTEELSNEGLLCFTIEIEDIITKQ